jgi:glycosyltransferase involved in cell wall biosynthesis
MKISVVTIAFNSAATIARTIQSVMAQKGVEVEYIVVDGLSKDNTVDIIKQYADGISHWVSEPDKGIYDAMNKGVQLATGEVVGMLNADDYYADEFALKRIVEAFQKNDCDATYADLHYKNGPKTTRVWKSGSYKPGAFKRGWMPPHPTFYLKKACYEKCGLYRTDMRSAADYELMLRMIHKHEVTLHYIPHVQVFMEVGGVSNANVKNRLNANKEDQRAWEVNDLKMPWLLPVLKPLRKLPQWVMGRI